jgi:hypothetical protein
LIDQSAENITHWLMMTTEISQLSLKLLVLLNVPEVIFTLMLFVIARKTHVITKSNNLSQWLAMVSLNTLFNSHILSFVKWMTKVKIDNT